MIDSLDSPHPYLLSSTGSLHARRDCPVLTSRLFEEESPLEISLSLREALKDERSCPCVSSGDTSPNDEWLHRSSALPLDEEIAALKSREVLERSLKAYYRAPSPLLALALLRDGWDTHRSEVLAALAAFPREDEATLTRRLVAELLPQAAGSVLWSLDKALQTESYRLNRQVMGTSSPAWSLNVRHSWVEALAATLSPEEATSAVLADPSWVGEPAHERGRILEACELFERTFASALRSYAALPPLVGVVENWSDRLGLAKPGRMVEVMAHGRPFLVGSTAFVEAPALLFDAWDATLTWDRRSRDGYAVLLPAYAGWEKRAEIALTLTRDGLDYAEAWERARLV